MPGCSQRRLEPGRKPRLVRTATDGVSAMEMREDDFVREQRRPFKGGGAVGIGAAVKFVLAVGQADEFGLAEPADEPAALALREQIF